MGKAYANRKPASRRPESDNYSTPISLVWELDKTEEFPEGSEIYEPASGAKRIVRALNGCGYLVTDDDIRTTGKDFTKCNERHQYIITNPPFSIFDQFVVSAKRVSKKFAFIAKTNFFGAYQREKAGIWRNLKTVYIFNRQVDYRTPVRKDGLFHVGNLVTGWFIWDMSWDKPYWETRIIDVNKYAKLGQYKENMLTRQI